MNKTVVGAVALLVAVGALSWNLVKTREQLEKAALRASQADERAAALEGESAKLSNALAQAKSLQTLPSGQFRELIRLRGEVGQLKRQLAQAGKSTAPAVEPAALVDEPPTVETVQTDQRLTVQAAAKLRDKQTLVLGNWAGPLGRRTVLLVTPTIGAPGANGQKEMTIRVYIADSDEKTVNRLGVGQMADPARGTVLDDANGQNLIASLKSAEGVTMLAAPSVALQSGGTGSISVGDPNTGTGIGFGLAPTLSADGKTIDLVLNGHIGGPPKDAQPQAPKP